MRLYGSKGPVRVFSVREKAMVLVLQVIKVKHILSIKISFKIFC